MQRVLNKEKLVETAERLQKRISERFPGSGLAELAGEVGQIIREALVRADSIRQPNLWIRGGLVTLTLLAVAGIIGYAMTQPAQVSLLDVALRFFDVTKGAFAYLAAAAIFLVTIEVRWKRRKALQAIHELRAMAHLIDMHQLTKSPDRIGKKSDPLTVAGRAMTADFMIRYLNYCTEMLSLVSKVGQLYVQDFPDAQALAAVDQFENLATDLSNKIWQKIMILDRIRADADEASESAAAVANPS